MPKIVILLNTELEHDVSNTKIMGLIPRELWIKGSIRASMLEKREHLFDVPSSLKCFFFFIIII